MGRLLRKRIIIILGILIISTTMYIFGVFTHIQEKDFKEFRYPYDGNVEKLVFQIRNGMEPDVQPINEYNFKYDLNPRLKCDNIINMRLVYIIKSTPNHFGNRMAIRKTWGFQKRFSDVEIRTVFLIGQTFDEKLQRLIGEESNQFRDIVQANFTDSYYNNTYKTMMGFDWAVKYCPDSKFYMFVDDDYYVSTKNVLRFIRYPTNYPQYLNVPMASLNHRGRGFLQALDFELQDDVRLYTGYAFISSPHRHYVSKWYISLEEYPYHMWPPYISAGAYILSKEALKDLFYTSLYTKHFRFDDIYVGILAFKAKIEPLHNEQFHFYKKPYYKFNYNYTVASHGYEDPEELLRVWIQQKSLGNA